MIYLTAIAWLALSVMVGHLLGLAAAHFVAWQMGLDTRPERESRASW